MTCVKRVSASWLPGYRHGETNTAPGEAPLTIEDAAFVLFAGIVAVPEFGVVDREQLRGIDLEVLRAAFTRAEAFLLDPHWSAVARRIERALDTATELNEAELAAIIKD